MQLIDHDLTRRHILNPDQAARVLAAICDDRLPINLDESMDFDGDLVLAPEDLRKCLGRRRIFRRLVRSPSDGGLPTARPGGPPTGPKAPRE